MDSIGALSNTDGEIEEQYSYDVYGKPDTTSSIGNPYLFTGRRFDDEISLKKLYYYRARVYSADLGRFLQADPMDYYDGMNMYTYVGNNPLVYLDPFGLCGKDDEERIRKIEQLQDYIKSAEAAMIANIESLNLIHKDIKWWHDYYWWLLVGNTTVSAVSVYNTMSQFSQAAHLAKTAEVITTNLPVHNAWDVSIKLYAASAEKLALAQTSTAADVGFTALSFLEILNISSARQKVISKYDPLLEQTLINIDTLSKGVKEARQEIRRINSEW